MKTIYFKIIIGIMLTALTNVSCKGQNAPVNNSESISKKVKEITKEALTDEQKAEAIFYSGIHYDKLTWLIGEIDVIVEEGYFDE